jgi:hypothetical protein
MKKITTVFVLLFTAIVSYSQESQFQPEWSFGANAGITLSRMRFSPRVSQSSLMQVSGGFTVRYISEDHFGIQIEINSSMRGWREDADTLTHPNQYARSLVYLELPLMTQLYFSMGKKTRLVINVGPQIGYNLGEKERERKINDVSTEIPSYYDQKIQRKFDYGIGGGMGVEARIGKGAFVLEGRYYFGLSDVFNNHRSDYFQSSSNQVAGIKLTYFFRIVDKKLFLP